MASCCRPLFSATALLSFLHIVLASGPLTNAQGTSCQDGPCQVSGNSLLQSTVHENQKAHANKADLLQHRTRGDEALSTAIQESLDNCIKDDGEAAHAFVPDAVALERPEIDAYAGESAYDGSTRERTWSDLWHRAFGWFEERSGNISDCEILTFYWGAFFLGLLLYMKRQVRPPSRRQQRGLRAQALQEAR